MQDRGGFEETIPQLIRQTWQLERSLQHQNRPFSQASNACQEEGANRVQRSNRQGTGLSDRRGNHHGAGLANTLGLFSDIPEEAKRGGKGMSGSKQLEQGHHQRVPQADDGGRDSPRTGWSNSVHKGRCFEGISSDTSYARSLTLDNIQLTSGTASILTDALWS